MNESMRMEKVLNFYNQPDKKKKKKIIKNLFRYVPGTTTQRVHVLPQSPYLIVM